MRAIEIVNLAIDRAMLQPILIVMHQETSTPGRVGHALRERGYPLDMRRPRFGDPLPTSMAEHAGAIIFGGPMSANDGDEKPYNFAGFSSARRRLSCRKPLLPCARVGDDHRGHGRTH